MKFTWSSTRLSEWSPRPCRMASLMTFLILNYIYVNASVYPTKPTSGTTYIAGQAGQVAWIDDGRRPLLGSMGKMRIELYARNDTFIATLARDLQTMSLHTTVLIPAIAPPSNHEYTMRFITIDPALTIYSANFAIMPNPLTYQLGPRPTLSLSSQVLAPGPGSITSVSSTRLGVPNRSLAGIVTMSYGGSAREGVDPPSATPNAAGLPNQHDGSKTNDAIARRGTSFLRSRISLSSKRSRATEEEDRRSNLRLDMLKKVRALKAKRESVVDIEKIKFKMVFILWPAMVALTLAF